MMAYKYDVFISYSSHDQKVAEDVCDFLEHHGYRCFVAYRDIPPGVRFASAIVDALDESAMMIAVFSGAFNSSSQTDREIELAAENKMPILTYRITNDVFTGEKKYYLKSLNWIDAFPNPEDHFDFLLQSIKKLLREPSTSPIVVDKTVKSDDATESVLENIINNMVRVEGGTFTMGAVSELDSDAEGDDAHQVTLSSFSIGRYEVTQEEWEFVMGSNPSYFKGAKRPVELVSWDDCQAFIRKLNALTGKNFRLPTEAEWEFAARGGNRSQHYKYAGSNTLGSVAWYDDNYGNETHSVGQKQANELGLYDMSGNVWEWCSDWYGSYSSSSQTNPKGPSTGSDRVFRGGSWICYSRNCRVSFRSYITPDIRRSNLGLRLAL